MAVVRASWLHFFGLGLLIFPEGPSAQYLRSLPEPLNIGYLDPLMLGSRLKVFLWGLCPLLGCLRAGCLDFNLLGFYGLYNIGAKGLTFWRGPEDS